ncbi:FAD-dependent oxidoreductase [Elizabethkingia argentiflava]|uniref:FAD-dependent oxidoreductase n=1 Tax=Elizabethkingia argenteiflava TaxID=2681556 RepID=A0A845PS14_9FLAO|nr:FAD-dependent oxidoreductase [Elizabethkingia argenteiflava]NAW50455.1 FAD-dependent oxidoreductase [Elizabethkingia argenteiflava]
MEKIDYIIVGDGYAAIFFAHQLIKNNKSFKLYSEGVKAASHISAGVCNPVVLKRYNKIWNDEALMHYLPLIFSEIENYLHKNYLIQENVVRIFHDEGEQKLWLRKADQPKFEKYLNPEIQYLSGLDNPWGVGRVNSSCRLDVPAFFADFFSYLEKNKQLVKEKFKYEDLDVEQKKYQNYSYTTIVFAEGVGVKKNPYFHEIPIQPNKGHRLSIRLDKAIEPLIIKKKHFLFRFSPHEYYYGGTYDRGADTAEIDTQSVEQLQTALEKMYRGAYCLDDIAVAFRATMADRRPVIGRHGKYNDLHIFNGLGARGVLNGGYFSRMLFDFIENKHPLHPEADVKRFYQTDKLF